MRIIILVFLFTSINIMAKPFVPENLNEVIVKIDKDPLSESIFLLLQKIKNNKNDLDTVDLILSLYIQQAKEKNDARYIGYAQSFIEPYRKKNKNSYMLNMHYVDMLQYIHSFDEALIVLKQTMQIKQNDVQAHLVAASIYQAQGKYSLGLRMCTPLIMLSSHLISTTCITTMKSHLGSLDESYQLLQKTYKKSLHERNIQTLQWTLSSLADMAYRLENNNQALLYLEESLELNSRDYHALKISADILIEEKRYKEVVVLLEKFNNIEALLLRYTVAKHYLGIDVQDIRNVLLTNVNILKLRNEKIHDEDIKYYNIIGDIE